MPDLLAEFDQSIQDTSGSIVNDNPDIQATQDPTLQEFDQMIERKNPVTKYATPKTWFGEAKFGLSRGLDSLQQMGYGVGALLTTGELHKKFTDAVKQQDEEIASSPASVPTYEGVDSFDTFMRYFSSGLGEIAPQIGEAVAAGAIGAVAGSAAAPGPGTAVGAIGGLIERKAVANLIKSKVDDLVKAELRSFAEGQVEKKALSETAKSLLVNETKNLGGKYGAWGAVAANSWGQEAASIYTDLQKDPNLLESDRRLSAVVGGFIAAAPDAGVQGWIASKFFKGAAKVSTEEIADASNYIVQFLKTYGKEVLKVVPAEAVQEGLQTAIEEAAKNYADPAKRNDIFAYTDEQKTSFVDAMFKGAIGGTLGGGISAIAERPNPKQLTPSPDPAVRQAERDIQGAADGILPKVTKEDVRITEINKRQEEISQALAQPDITPDVIETLNKENAELDKEYNDLAGAETAEETIVNETPAPNRPLQEVNAFEEAIASLNRFYGEETGNRDVSIREEPRITPEELVSKKAEIQSIVNEIASESRNKERGKLYAESANKIIGTDEFAILAAENNIKFKKGKGFQVEATKSGQIVITLGAVNKLAGYSDTLAQLAGNVVSEASRGRQVRNVDSILTHEVAHIADNISIRNKWKKTDKSVDFNIYAQREFEARGKALRLAARQNPKLFKGIGSLAKRVYEYAAEGSLQDYQLGQEIPRMMVELARTGRIDEVTQAIAQARAEANDSKKGVLSDFLKSWIKAIEGIRDVLKNLINSDKAPYELRTAYENINKVLDKYGVLVNEKVKEQQKQIQENKKKNEKLKNETTESAIDEQRRIRQFSEPNSESDGLPKTKGKGKDVRDESSRPARAAEPKSQRIISTALYDPSQPELGFVKGEKWNSPHASITREAILAGFDDTKMQYGFIVNERTIIPSEENGIEWYKETLKNPELVNSAVIINNGKIVKWNDIAVPSGKDRKGGWFEVDSQEEANNVVAKLSGKDGFDNLRIESKPSLTGSIFSVHWGESLPDLSSTTKIGDYLGYKRYSEFKEVFKTRAEAEPIAVDAGQVKEGFKAGPAGMQSQDLIESSASQIDENGETNETASKSAVPRLKAGVGWLWDILPSLLKEDGKFGKRKMIRQDGTMLLKDYEKALDDALVTNIERTLVNEIVPEAFTDGKVNVKLLIKGLKEKGPIVEVKKLGEQTDPLQQRLAEIQHELETIWPEWNNNYDPNRQPPNERAKELFAEYKKVGAEFDLKDARDEASSARYSFLGPKSEQDMPGYVEVLVRVPTKDFVLERQEGESIEQARARNERQLKESEKFRGPHFGSEDTNVLAFFRGYEETLPDGRKAFHVIEVQSDWGQKNRRRWTLKNDAGQVTLGKFDSRGEAEKFLAGEPELQQQRFQAVVEVNPSAPDHPLLASYEPLALKAAIDHARSVGATDIIIQGRRSVSMMEGHDKAGKFATENDIPQFKGMSVHYPDDYNDADTGTLGSAMKKLTGTEGERVEMGVHKASSDTGRAVGPEETIEVTEVGGTNLQVGQQLTSQEFRNASDAAEDQGLSPAQGKPTEIKGSPVFRNPDGTPKSNITGRLYDLTKAFETLDEQGGFTISSPARAAVPRFTKRDEQQLKRASDDQAEASRVTHEGIAPKASERKKIAGKGVYGKLTPEDAYYLTGTKTQAAIYAEKTIRENGGAIEVGEELLRDPMGKKYNITEDDLGGPDLGPNDKLTAVYENAITQLANIHKRLKNVEASVRAKNHPLDLARSLAMQSRAILNRGGKAISYTGFHSVVDNGVEALDALKDAILNTAESVIGKKAREQMERLSDYFNGLMDTVRSTQIVNNPQIISILRMLQKFTDKNKFAKGYRKTVSKKLAKLKAIVNKAASRAAEAMGESDDSYDKADNFVKYLITEMSGNPKDVTSPTEHEVVLSALSKMTRKYAKEIGLISKEAKIEKISKQKQVLALLKNEELYSYFISTLREEYIAKYNDQAEADVLFGKLANRMWEPDQVKAIVNEKLREIGESFAEIVQKHFSHGEYTTTAVAEDIRKYMESNGVKNEDLVNQLVQDIEDQMSENIDAAREKFFKSAKTLRAFLKHSLTSLAEAAREHYRHTENMEGSFADYLVEEFYFPEAEARQMAKIMQAEFNSLVKSERGAILERFVKNATKDKKLDDKKVKGATQRILELANLGAMRSETVYKALQERFGLPPYSEEIADKIQTLGDMIAESKSDRQKDELRQKLADYITSTKGLSTSTSYLSWMYFSMLSGPSTHLVNIGGNATNLLGHIAVESVKHPSKIPKMLSSLMRAAAGVGQLEARHSFWNGIQLGKDGTKYFNSTNPLELQDVFFTSDTIRKKFGDTLADADIKTAKFVHKLARGIKANYVGRALIATDIFFYKIAKEMAYAARVDGDLAGTPEMWESALNEARSDMLAIGNDPTTKEGQLELKVKANAIFEEKRLQDNSIVNEERQTAWREANDEALDVTFNSEPKYFLGRMASYVEKFTNEMPIGKVIIPFTRISANVTNAMLEWTPFGFARYAFQQAGNPFKLWTDGKWKPESDIAIRAILGTGMIFALLAMMADEDDDPNGFTIYSNGPRDNEKRRLLQEKGWKPSTILINGQYYSYLYTPLAMAFSIVGKQMDDYRDGKIAHAGDISIATSAVALSEAVTNQSFLATVKDLLSAIDSHDPETKVLKVLSRFASIPIPNAVKQLDKFIDPSLQSASSFSDAIIKELPIARHALNPTLNIFGEPIARTRGAIPIPGMERFVTSERVDDEVINLMVDRSIHIPGFSKSTKLGDEKMTEQQYYDYVRTAGPRIKQRIKNELGSLRMMTREAIQDRVERIATEEKKSARNILTNSR